MLFLDTSVIVALYVQEAKSDKAQRLVSSQQGIVICPLAEVEFCSAISRLYRMKMLTKQEAEQVLASFDLHIKQGYFTFYPVNQNVYDKARKWLIRLDTPLRSLDALQLAVADINGFIFATADRDLVKAAKKLHVACILV